MIMKLNQHGLVSTTGQPLADDLYVPLLEAHVAELTPVINLVLEKIDEVHMNVRRRLITVKGLGERLKALAEAGAKRISDLTTARRRKLDQDIARDEQLLGEVVSPESANRGPAAFIARREALYRDIRENLFRITIGPTREAAVITSVMTDPVDDARDLVLALQQAPALVRRELVHDRVFEDAKVKYLARANPEALKSHNAARAALGIVLHNQQAGWRATTGSSNVPASLVEIPISA